MATLPNQGFKDRNCKRLLFMEGRNDCYVLTAFRKKRAIPHNFNIIDSNSDGEAIDDFLSFIKVRDKTVLGLVLDADSNLTERWDNLKTRLSDEGHDIDFPDRAVENGLIIEAKGLNPRLGVWIMPDNKQHGMLEDFCCEIADHAALSFAKECVAEAKQKDLTSYKDGHQKKAELSTYLAWHNPPGMKMGQAITADILKTDHPLAQKFSNWLKQLFKD